MLNNQFYDSNSNEDVPALYPETFKSNFSTTNTQKLKIILDSVCYIRIYDNFQFLLL